nr:MAG TPA: hypothetical protein [Caudoviricetes sp.]
MPVPFCCEAVRILTECAPLYYIVYVASGF